MYTHIYVHTHICTHTYIHICVYVYTQSPHLFLTFLGNAARGRRLAVGQGVTGDCVCAQTNISFRIHVLFICLHICMYVCIHTVASRPPHPSLECCAQPTTRCRSRGRWRRRLRELARGRSFCISTRPYPWRRPQALAPQWGGLQVYMHMYLYKYIRVHIYTDIRAWLQFFLHFKAPATIQIRQETHYGVATISRLHKIIGLFCKRALLKRRYSAKETYDFKEPTNRSHPMSSRLYHTNKIRDILIQLYYILRVNTSYACIYSHRYTFPEFQGVRHHTNQIEIYYYVSIIFLV